jgi:hypothetical protein
MGMSYVSPWRNGWAPGGAQGTDVGQVVCLYAPKGKELMLVTLVGMIGQVPMRAAPTHGGRHQGFGGGGFIGASMRRKKCVSSEMG